MLKLILRIKNKLINRRGEQIMINKTRLRAYSKTMANGVREIDEIPEAYRVPVYLELLAEHNWTIDMVDERYVATVKEELGLTETVQA